VFEIVERILAALIILALLTLLIILAFPVPPRDTVAPAPSGETKQAERTDPAPKSSPPASTPAPKVEPAPATAPKGTDPAPAAKTDAKQTPVPKAEPSAPRKVVDRIPPSSAPAPVVVSSDPKRPAITVRAKSETERVVYSRDERVSRYRSRTAQARRERERAREIARREWREPVFVGECEDEDCDCCGGGCGKSSRPYWAEPRRQRWAQAPVGACPY
jgi:hypothetical protein